MASAIRQRPGNTPLSLLRQYGRRSRVSQTTESPLRSRLFDNDTTLGAPPSPPEAAPPILAPQGMLHRQTLRELQTSAQPHKWLVAPGFFCQGHLTLLGGVPGGGKTSFALFCADQVSTGSTHANVLWIDIEERSSIYTEDDIAYGEECT